MGEQVAAGYLKKDPEGQGAAAGLSIEPETARWYLPVIRDREEIPVSDD